jgi:hypothetical protein
MTMLSRKTITPTSNPMTIPLLLRPLACPPVTGSSGPGVLVGEMGVLVGGMDVLAGELGVLAGELGVLVGRLGVLVGGTGVSVISGVGVKPADAGATCQAMVATT